jgi:hypothetical protein
MNQQSKSIRPFLGSKNYEVSRAFYQDLGFKESILSINMSYFETDGLGFYLQDAYVKDWVNNTMVFMEVNDVDSFYQQLLFLKLNDKYKDVKILPVQNLDWGKECFLHDPAGNLWHFGQFKNM